MTLQNREVLYSKDAFEKLYPASITKVMTALIAIKYGNLEDQVTVTEDAVITETGATLCGIPAWRHFDIRAAFIWSDASFRK